MLLWAHRVRVILICIVDIFSSRKSIWNCTCACFAYIIVNWKTIEICFKCIFISLRNMVLWPLIQFFMRFSLGCTHSSFTFKSINWNLIMKTTERKEKHFLNEFCDLILFVESYTIFGSFCLPELVWIFITTIACSSLWSVKITRRMGRKAKCNDKLQHYIFHQSNHSDWEQD